MKEYGDFDLTSEPSAGEGAFEQRPTAPARPGTSMRVLFNCCRIYTRVMIPKAVREGRLTTWRFHCPRCGRAAEVPLPDMGGGPG